MPSPESPAATQAVGAVHRRRILVIDDERDVRDYLALVLGKLGHHVTLCGDGQEAVERFGRLREPFDLVILDLVMPGDSGQETFRALRRIDPDVRVLVVTGHSLEGEAQQILDAGAAGFIQKPFQLDELSRKVAEALA